jgi:two-component system response regulator HydG
VVNDRLRILVVDDDLGALRTTAFILEHKGYAVTTVQDGPAALEKVQQQPFDVIFMDIRMPGMDGVEVYRRVKRVQPGVAVVMMTAYAVQELVQQALQEGALGILYKPLDVEQMIATIERAGTAEAGPVILVVDDDPLLCSTLQNILARMGRQVNVASSGEEAIAAVREVEHDIVFIDMKMPAIDGLETYRAIKEANPETVAVMMTGYLEEMEPAVGEALRDHAYTCLYKPLQIESLLKVVDEIWERKRSRGEECRGTR